MGAAYIVNTVIERIDGLEAHLDRVLSRLLQGLHQLEGKLDDMTNICNTTLAQQPFGGIHSGPSVGPALDTPSFGEEKALITINLFSERYVGSLNEYTQEIERNTSYTTDMTA